MTRVRIEVRFPDAPAAIIQELELHPVYGTPAKVSAYLELALWCEVLALPDAGGELWTWRADLVASAVPYQPPASSPARGRS